MSRTIGLLSAYLTAGHSEIIIVENGSSDATLEIARANAVDTDNVTFHVLQSDKGMGNALRCGIQASSGHRILLTADDLPFGTGDLEQDAKLATKPPVVIGSKAHKESVTPRGLTRKISSLGFRILRRVLLGSKVGDSQGTLIVDGDWLRKMVNRLDDPGFLFSTQVVFAAEQQGLAIVEVPVTLAPDDEPAETTIKLGDIAKMARGLLTLRSRRIEFGSTPEGLLT